MPQFTASSPVLLGVRTLRWVTESKQNKTRNTFKNVCLACLLQVCEWGWAGGSRELPEVAFQLNKDDGTIPTWHSDGRQTSWGWCCKPRVNFHGYLQSNEKYLCCVLFESLIWQTLESEPLSLDPFLCFWAKHSFAPESITDVSGFDLSCFSYWMLIKIPTVWSDCNIT